MVPIPPGGAAPPPGEQAIEVAAGAGASEESKGHVEYAEVVPSCRALSGRLKFTVRRHKFNKDSPCFRRLATEF